MDNTALIIVPDIHGRTFWKKAMKQYDGTPVVFLGDYLDPYPQEGITQKEAWDNFMEIVEFKRQHPDSVHLLLGNHDLGYLDTTINRCRRDTENAGRNRWFLSDNLNLFDLTFETEAGGRKFLLSHAGVNRRWLEWHFGKEAQASASLFNMMFHSKGYDQLCKALRNISEYRGGDWPFGSMVWADMEEFTEDEAALPGIVQIFGHTHQGSGTWAVIGDDEAYCIDCSRIFRLGNDGSVAEL